MRIQCMGTFLLPPFVIDSYCLLCSDELIKERKKEVKKEKKHESVKKGTTTQHSKELPLQNAKAVRTKTAQVEKRSAVVNKNRGMSAVATTSVSSTSGSKGTKTPPQKQQQKKKSPKTKAAPTTSERTKPITAATKQQKKNAKVPLTAVGKPQVPQQKKKKSATTPAATQQPKKQPKPTQQQIVRIIRQQPAPPATKATASNALSASAKPRQVVRSTTTRSKIRITIQQQQRHQPTASRATKRQAKAPLKNAVMNVVLPAKVARNFSSKAATSAEKVVRRVQNRKQAATSKNGAFVVRKPFSVRKL